MDDVRDRTPAGQFGAVNGVAVDDDPSSPAYGDVYVDDPGKDVVDVFNASGAYQSQLTGTPSGGPFSSPTRVAVDPASGDLYVADAGSHTIDEFSPTGTWTR